MKEELIRQIDSIENEVRERVAGVSTLDEAKALKIAYLGKKGAVTDLLKEMGRLSKEDRPFFGKRINECKTFVDAECSSLIRRLEGEATQKTIEAEAVDISLPPRAVCPGRIHPITKTFNELITVFTGMGFSVYEGPEVETDFYNFEALNHPKDHPARDLQDTFYLDEDRLLRTHTSPVQIRVMESKKPPIFMIGPGAVYRRDTPDLTHSPKFHQVEGLMVDKRITFGDLKGVMNEFIHRVFGAATATRFRPSFFPFTEPSAEMDIQCVACKGNGCRICKDTGWLEILGCGMVDPNVFESVGYDPNEVTGFAFGMGVERIAMLKYNINDIRLFYENNVKFLEQF